MVLMICAAAFSVFLMVRLWGGCLNYIAYGRLLADFIIAVGVFLAAKELTDNQRGARASANAAVFDQYKMYLSINYQREVRRPAWLSLLKAESDSKYHKGLLSGLAGELVGNETAEYMEKSDEGTEPASEDKKNLAIHDGYHRVQDIFGFFTMLSLLSLNADHEVIAVCNFFYDRWRIPLHRIVKKLEEYTPLSDNSDGTLARLKKRRCDEYKKTLNRLDEQFNLEEESWDNDPIAK